MAATLPAPARRLLLICSLLAVALPARAAEPPVPADHAARMAASQRLFTEQVRGYLEKNCLECHGGGKERSGFSLATRELLLKGGDRGVAVVPGRGIESALVKSISHADEPHMPPKKPAAAKEVIEAVAKWIDLGAAYDKPLTAAAEAAVKKPLAVTDKDRQYWAYRPLQPAAPPAVKDASWPRTPIDQFLRAKMEAAGIAPAADADRRTLARRVAFDLVGLPPESAEVEALAAASDFERAYEAFVDRLLASPHFGERWARHWLDPARFAESHGFEHDYFRPFAYHYRDFVIRAFNADMPYDQFVRWQVAGDELAPDDPLALAATGFLGAGVYPTQITTREAERVRYDAMDDMLATTGHAMLSLTVGCARCHDHKFDPIPAADYYRLLAAFTTTVRSEVDWDFGTDDEKQAMRAFEERLKPLTGERQRYEEKELPQRLADWLAERKESGEKPSAPERVAKVLQKLTDSTAFDKLAKAEREQAIGWFKAKDAGWRERDAAVRAVEKQRPKDTRTKMQVCAEGRKPMRHHTADPSVPDFYPQTFQLKRGDVAQKDGVAELGFLQVLCRSPEGESRWTAEPQAASSGRRASLARWLTDVEAGAGALAARSIVNRLWHHHFGRGIVATINDFGLQGEPPSHPDLLEWLASDLVAHGWNLKRVHKQMVMSRAYRLASGPGPAADPDNRLMSRRSRRRLEAEAVRDNLLAVGGRLDRTLFGPGTLDESMRRRSIYFTVQRSRLIPMLQAFDWPDTLTSAPARPTTVVAPQALVFLNGAQVRDCAAGLAEHLQPALRDGPATAVDHAYRTAFARPPSADESAAGVEFLRSGRPLADYCLVLLSLNEFIYVD